MAVRQNKTVGSNNESGPATSGLPGPRSAGAVLFNIDIDDRRGHAIHRADNGARIFIQQRPIIGQVILGR